MNKERRRELSKIVGELKALKERVEAVMNEEQYGFDNLSEGLQQTMRGEAMEEAVSNLESAIESIDEAIDAIEEASM